MARPRVEVLPPPDLLLAHDVNICAPMVRYSKRAFRATCARYDTHWTTTPMIVAKEFSRSAMAREADFSTSDAERAYFEPLADRRGSAADDQGEEEEEDVGEEEKAMQKESGANGGQRPQRPDAELRERRRRRGLVGTRTQWTRPLPARALPDEHSRLHAGSGDGEEDDGVTDDNDNDENKAARLPRRLLRGTLIGQLAASESKSLADGAEVLAPHVDGLELNCGCPTSSAWSDHIGAYLLRQPDLVADMVRTTKARLGWSYPVCVKIRLDPDRRRTATLVQNAVHAGASVLTVHGRTRHQSSAGHPVDLDGIAFAISVARSCGSATACGATSAMHHVLAADARNGGDGPQKEEEEEDAAAAAAAAAVVVSGLADGGGGAGGPIPCVANGDVFTLAEADEWRRRTGAQGVMSARGLLANPALFAGFDSTPPEAVQLFCKEALRGGGLPFQHFQRHVGYMLESALPRSDSVYFNSLYSTAAVMDWLHEEGWWKG